MSSVLESGQVALASAHAWSEKNPKVSYSLVWTGATFAWYAMPDFCRSKKMRFLGKSALFTGVLLHELHLDASGEQTARLEAAADKVASDWSKERQLLVAGTVLAASVGATVALEKFIFRRGERKRAEGRRLAHTKQALWLSGLAAVGAKLVGDDLYGKASA
ncbi:MAG: peptidase S9 [Actinomycetaceae bacterium]|nr:peptidase S9 [Actinomycetaceae bacterium]